jgi:hypothetical protein
MKTWPPDAARERLEDLMTQPPGRCSVCGASDQRALVEVALAGGARATLCGTHALMHSRARVPARTVAELRTQLRDRRGRRDRREDGDELGDALTAAFNGERRGAGRRSTDLS